MDKFMSQKEVNRAQVLDKLNEGKISQQQAAKQQRPERWSGATRNWQPVLVMYLNPDQHIKNEQKKGDLEHKIAA